MPAHSGQVDDTSSAQWRTVMAAIVVVLITAEVLYPLILQLMRRVTRLSADLLVANIEMLKVLGGAIAKRDADRPQQELKGIAVRYFMQDIEALL